MTKIVLFVALMITLGKVSFAQHKHSFEIKNGHFFYDGKVTAIHSGEMHYARIPEEYWKQRLLMAKAMGLNTIATYVFWNYHESWPGVWDFKTGNRNLRKFIQTAAAAGLMVILRPGPYVCAEWEFGGFPWWLQKNKSLVMRTDNKPFLDSCNTYISKLMTEVKDLQVSNGGPIIMVQVENEFASYVEQRKDIPMEQHKAYLYAIRDQLIQAGVTVPLFTADADSFNGGVIEGALPAANGENDIARLRKSINHLNAGNGPYMIAEFYPGWLDHWTEPFQKVATAEVVNQMKKYLDNDVSFNFYVVHGGSNFGFTSGANYDDKHDIQPDLTSYDYDAPISEAGWATPKYKALRDVLKRKGGYKVPEIPAAIPVITIPLIKLTRTIDIASIENKITPVIDDQPLTFEELNQGNGYVLYTKKFATADSGKLAIDGLRDYATVYVNDKRVGVLNRCYKNYSMNINIPPGATLKILVENMGRINYGSEITNNLKGIISPVTIDNNEITGNWNMYKFPLESKPDFTNLLVENVKGRPTFYEGSFMLTKTGDTFLDMSNWGKGIVYVNGHHLGRYWSVGPQQTLYVPGVWLKKGTNEIVIFDQLNDVIHTSVRSLSLPILNKLQTNSGQ